MSLRSPRAGRLAAVLAAGVLATGALPGEGLVARPLWKQAAAAPCRLTLELAERDSVEIQRLPAPARLLGPLDAGRLRVVDADGRTRLSLATAPGQEPAVLRLEAPPGCDLEVTTSAGSVDARGPVEAPWRATSVTGNLTLWVEPSAGRSPDLAIELATSGEIAVDFSVEIDYRHHHEPAKRGSISLGTGSVPVRLESRQGAVRVLRSAPPAEPAIPSPSGGIP